MKLVFPTLLLLALEAQAANILVVDVRNQFIFASNPITDETGSPLTSADTLQLGYFDTSIAPTSSGAAAFDNFVPFEDPDGSVMGALGLNESGQFSGQVRLSDETNATALPSPTVQLAIRFFNGPSAADATFFNTVTNDDWQFTFLDEGTSPAPLPSLIDISGFNQNSIDDIASAVWQGTPFQTSVQAIPEPSAWMSAILGTFLLVGQRRRK